MINGKHFRIHTSLSFAILAGLILSGCDFTIQEQTTIPIDVNPIRLTSDPFRKETPAWSPDGTRILYSSVRNLTLLQKYSLAGTVEELVSIEDDFADSRFAFSPDGQQLVYHSRSRRYLWRVDLQDPSRNVLLTPNHLNAHDPAWSPDGQWIAFVDFLPDTIGFGLWMIPATGGQATLLFSSQHRVGTPTWSPDGTRIAFAQGGNNYQVWIYSLAEKRTELFAGVDFTAAIEPDWSPNGNLIAFTGNKNDTLGIWIKPVTGGEPRKLTRHTDFAITPAWSPDGKRIAFTSYRDQIWVISLNGDELLNPDISAKFPVWLPESQFLVQAMTVPKADLQQVDLLDSTITTTTHASAYFYDQHPGWFPDSKRFVFSRVDSRNQRGQIFLYADNQVTPLLPFMNLPNQQNPEISPDGSRLLFDDGIDIYLYDFENQRLNNLTTHINRVLRDPTWAPDGNRFACVGVDALMIFSLQTQPPALVTRVPGEFRRVHWSAENPDLGSFILAVWSFDLYLISPETLNPELVVNGSRDGDWSPDASKITYIWAEQLYMIPIIHRLPP